jgi:hypothetical protein
VQSRIAAHPQFWWAPVSPVWCCLSVCVQVFTITVPAEQESSARQLVLGMSPNARLTYSVGGTLKFELPTSEVSGLFCCDPQSLCTDRGMFCR